MAALKNIAIVGAGHMGIAIALGLRRSNPNISIAIIDSDPEKYKNISGANISLLAGLPDAPTFEAMILAIPPQAFNSFSHNNPQLKSLSTLMISVMAGVTISELEKYLKTSQVCRAIPNLPCAINEGVTVLMPHPTITQKNKLLAIQILSQLGTLIMTQDERAIDDATALVGGGPAYISYFAEALIAYAVSAGFDKATAFSIVTQIIHGTSALLKTNTDTPETLCKKVMTPNGTTERAIDVLNNKQVKNIIIDALKSSSMRSTELGRSVQSCKD